MDKASLRKEPTHKLPALRPVVILAIFLLGLTLVGSFWLYFTGIQSMRAQAKEQGLRLYVEGFHASHNNPEGSNTVAETNGPNVPPDPEKTAATLLSQMEDWALKLVLATGAGSVCFALVLLMPLASWRTRVAKQLAQKPQVVAAPDTGLLQETTRELQRTSMDLEHQKTQYRILQEQLQEAENEIEKRVTARTAHLTAMFTQLEEELNDRKQMERALAQQAQELGRSKDVLEMHVQARTQELQKLQRRYEHILNSAGEGIYGLDLQGKTTFVNPAAAKLTGWKVEELIGKMEQDIFMRQAPGQAPIAAKQGDNPTEAVFFRKDGTSFLVESVRTPIVDKDKPVGAVVIFKDITDRKRTEDALARKAAELARSNAELEQFAYVASHDLQEPLRKIQAFGDRLKGKVESAKLQEGRDYLERMQSAAARMQRLIDDLLTFSRVISATQPFVPVDPGQILKEVLTDLELRIEQTKAKIEVGNLPPLDADPMQMRQLLQNLIGNALKFQPPNAKPLVKIQGRIIKSPLATEADPRPEEEMCELTIQDNGIGFEEQYSEKIFAMFQRLHGRGEYEGTGVGLAVCRRITDRHGGTIQAKSKPGEGATFIITLPVHHTVKSGQKATGAQAEENQTEAPQSEENHPAAAKTEANEAKEQQ